MNESVIETVSLAFLFTKEASDKISS